MSATPELLRLRDVCAAVGLSRITIWRLRCAGEFPNPIQLHGKQSAYRADEIAAWIEDRPRMETAPAL